MVPPVEAPATPTVNWELTPYDLHQVPVEYLTLNTMAVMKHLDKAKAKGLPIPTIPGIMISEASPEDDD